MWLGSKLLTVQSTFYVVTSNCYSLLVPMPIVFISVYASSYPKYLRSHVANLESVIDMLSQEKRRFYNNTKASSDRNPRICKSQSTDSTTRGLWAFTYQCHYPPPQPPPHLLPLPPQQRRPLPPQQQRRPTPPPPSRSPILSPKRTTGTTPTILQTQPSPPNPPAC
uniref:Uncharacterized protein n=1 Tax=Octopus bimaculoides TaxID=37653 RepID=A0A0L8HIZ7_OCTBM